MTDGLPVGSARPSSADRTAATRAALMAAAEQLMAEHGVEGVDLRDILHVAGQRNSSAIHYHFGDRDGLIEAIIARHRRAVDAIRVAQLDRLEARGAVSIRSLVDAWVTPMASVLSTTSGRRVVIITTELTARLGATRMLDSGLPHTDGLRRLATLLVDRVDGSPATRRFLVASCMMTTPTLLADVARDIERGVLSVAQARPRRRIVIDLTTRALGGT
jgi:AcrR family transcriptional regulator